MAITGSIAGFHLYVNQRWLPTPPFVTLEHAKLAANPYIQSQSSLQIMTASGRVREWNYQYDTKQWEEYLSS